MKCAVCEIGCNIRAGSIGVCGMYVEADGEIRERYPGRYLAAVDTAIESMPMVQPPPGQVPSGLHRGLQFQMQRVRF